MRFLIMHQLTTMSLWLVVNPVPNSFGYGIIE